MKLSTALRRAASEFEYKTVSRIGIATAKYENHPYYNRFLAGLHVLTWTRTCGWSWRHAWKMAMGYWETR